MKKSNDYSELSKSLTAKINKTDKKKYGIFFTPPETIIKNMEFLMIEKLTLLLSGHIHHFNYCRSL